MKLKITRTSWLIIIIGFFIIILAGLGVIRSQQVEEQNELNQKLAVAQSKLQLIQLDQISQHQAELEQQLSETDSESESARVILSQPMGSIIINDLLFDVAEANNVEVTEIKSSGMVEQKIEEVPCLALSLVAKVEGEVTDLVGFISQLNEDMTTGVVESLEISIPETMERKPSANIKVVVYTYQGS